MYVLNYHAKNHIYLKHGNNSKTYDKWKQFSDNLSLGIKHTTTQRLT